MRSEFSHLDASETNLESSENTTMEKKYSVESLDLMRAVKTLEGIKERKVSSPGELFAVLMAMGYRRGRNELNIQQQACEFLEEVKDRLIVAKRTAPTYDEIVGVMHSLGYRRAKNLAAGW